MKKSPARISQLLFLAMFLVLFVQTEYRGVDRINAAVNAFFRADPLVLLSCLLAEKAWNRLLLPAALMIVATLLLGRFFCGWICPLGTLLDLLGPARRTRAPLGLLRGNLKYWLLLPLLASSLFSINLAGLLDPLAILLRGLTFLVYPFLGLSIREGWVGLYRLIGERRDALAPAYGLLRDHLLPFRETLYPLGLFSALILLGIIALERYERRNWCRNLCPLGTLLGLLARFSPVRRTPAGLCGDCGGCRELCPTSFVRDRAAPDECILCQECRLNCPAERVGFRFPALRGRPVTPLPERRLLLGGVAAGMLLALPARFRQPENMTRLLRPPGVRDEERFLEKCVRCGECIKVCLRNALYPAVLQAGFEGIYTPLLIPRLGYCEYNCTLCGQVCPSGAIPALELAAKQVEVIGKAVIDRNHCLPFAKQVDCIVCEEHCPVGGKAIRSREAVLTGPDGITRTVKQPFVLDELCNGCGICENVCPLETKAGIEVFGVRNRTPLAGPAGSAGPGEPAGTGTTYP